MTTTRLAVACIFAGLGSISQMSFADTNSFGLKENRQIIPVTSDVNAMENGTQNFNDNKLSDLIREKEEDRIEALKIEQSTRIRSLTSSHASNFSYDLDFKQWLNGASYRANEVEQYRNYLSQYVGAQNIPPMNQLLTTARSWQKCGYEPYEVPPRELWSNMLPTIKLYSVLKQQGIFPASTEIRSVYRSPGLNSCAGGAAGSKHLTNGAMDVWVPEYDEQPWYQSQMQDRLCEFWISQGEAYNFGLGIYASGAIHIDTQGHRSWGIQNTTYDSPCRYLNDEVYK